MRRRIARTLRKWADLIDPRTNPQDGITIKITCDTSDAIDKIDELTKRIEYLSSLDPKFPIPLGGDLMWMPPDPKVE